MADSPPASPAGDVALADGDRRREADLLRDGLRDGEGRLEEARVRVVRRLAVVREGVQEDVAALEG